MSQYIFTQDYKANGNSYCPPNTTCAGVGVIHDFKKGDIIDGEGQCVPDFLTAGPAICKIILTDKNIGVFSFTTSPSIQLPFKPYVKGQSIAHTPGAGPSATPGSPNVIFTLQDLVIAVVVILLVIAFIKATKV